MGIGNIPSSMLACQVVGFNKPYKIHEVPSPQPSSLHPNDLLVKVAVASLCHTDGMVSSGIFHSSLPQTASHEGAGTVVAVGSGVKDFKAGDRVLCGLTTHRCGECISCRGPENEKHYCPNVEAYLGVTRDGAFAEYLTCDSKETSLLPDKISFETAAPLACAGRTIYRGVVGAKLRPGQWLGLVGSGGGLGHLGIQFAKALGLRVIGIDARDEGLELSKQTGADVVVDARKGTEEVVKEVQKATGGDGCPVTITISDAKTAAALACAITMMHGRMIQIAQPDEVSVPFRELIFRDIHIEGSLMSSVRQDYEMLDLAAKHNITVKTNPFYGLKEIPKLIELAHGGKMQGKGIVIVDEQAIKEERKRVSTLV